MSYELTHLLGKGHGTHQIEYSTFPQSTCTPLQNCDCLFFEPTVHMEQKFLFNAYTSALEIHMHSSSGYQDIREKFPVHCKLSVQKYSKLG